MNILAEQAISLILQNEMGFTEGTDPTIWIRSQNVKIPGDNRFYANVGMVDSAAIGAQFYMEQQPIPATNPVQYKQVEVQRTNVRENIQIDIFSRSNDAITRRWEVTAALTSLFSKQTQEKYQFKIMKLPTSFVNSSGAEGGSNLNRFSLIFPCLVWYKKSLTLSPDTGQYYDDFNTRVDDEKTIGTPHGAIEFNIKGETIT